MRVNLDYQLLNQIVRCINDSVGFGREAFAKLSLATDVARDLGIDGDDASELMAEFFNDFHVEVHDYDAYRYFVPEGYDLFSFRREKDRRGNIPLRVGMLYLAAESKRWETLNLERVDFSFEPLYTRAEDIPVVGYKIKVE